MVKLQKIQMTEEDLVDKKLHLEHCKIGKDESDISLEELLETLEVGLADKFLDDDIERLEEDINKKSVKDSWGNDINATEADLIRMKMTLSKFKKQKELKLPSRQIIHNINKLREAKKRIDAPENQIKKLEKEIREKAYYLTAKETPSAVN